MIVLDASVVVEILIGGARAAAIIDYLAEGAGAFAAPHLLDAEVMNALRNLVAGQRLDPNRVDELLGHLAALPTKRYALLPLTRRMWELRHNFTAYDAAYIALAETTGATLCTCDAKLRKGHRAHVRVFKD